MKHCVSVSIVRNAQSSHDSGPEVHVNGEHIANEHVRRSSVLLDLLEVEGETTLPISEASFRTWLDYRSEKQDSLDASIDALQVASYLGDEACRISCTRHVAAEIRRSVRCDTCELCYDTCPIPVKGKNSAGEVLKAMAPLSGADITEVFSLLQPYELTHVPHHLVPLALEAYRATELNLSMDSKSAPSTSLFLKRCPKSAPITSIKLCASDRTLTSPLNLPGDSHQLSSLSVHLAFCCYEAFKLQPPLSSLTSLTSLEVTAVAEVGRAFFDALQQLTRLQSVSLDQVSFTLDCHDHLITATPTSPLPMALAGVTHVMLRACCWFDDEVELGTARALLSVFSAAQLKDLELMETAESGSSGEDTIFDLVLQKLSLRALTHLYFISAETAADCDGLLPRFMESNGTALRSLSLPACEGKPRDMAALSQMTFLERLAAERVPISALDSLTALTGLQALVLYGSSCEACDEFVRRASQGCFVALTKLVLEEWHGTGWVGLAASQPLLRHVRFGIDAGYPGIEVDFARLLGTCTALTHLDMWVTRDVLANRGFYTLSGLAQLKTLNLTVGDTDIHFIKNRLLQVVSSASAVPSLASLSLACCRISDNCRIVSRCLSVLDLPRHSLRTIAKSISGLELLEELKLPCVKLGGADAVDFAEHISRLVRLERIEVTVRDQQDRIAVLAKLYPMPLRRGISWVPQLGFGPLMPGFDFDSGSE